MEEDPALPLVAFSRREDPRDVLVLPEGARPKEVNPFERMMEERMRRA